MLVFGLTFDDIAIDCKKTKLLYNLINDSFKCLHLTCSPNSKNIQLTSITYDKEKRLHLRTRNQRTFVIFD